MSWCVCVWVCLTDWLTLPTLYNSEWVKTNECTVRLNAGSVRLAYFWNDLGCLVQDYARSLPCRWHFVGWAQVLKVLIKVLAPIWLCVAYFIQLWMLCSYVFITTTTITTNYSHYKLDMVFCRDLCMCLCVS